MDSEALATFAGKYGVRLLLQFGSTVSGRVHPLSDLDLAVLLEESPASWSRSGEIAEGLQSLFPDTRADVAIINHADPLFLKQVVERCRLVYGRPGALSELKMYAFKRYQDHRRFLEMERTYVRRRIRALTS